MIWRFEDYWIVDMFMSFFCNDYSRMDSLVQEHLIGDYRNFTHSVMLEGKEDKAIHIPAVGRGFFCIEHDMSRENVISTWTSQLYFTCSAQITTGMCEFYII